MSKKLDKKSMFFRQAALCGLTIEGIVAFKVLSHYTVVVWNTILSIPTVMVGAFASICEQVAHVFGA